MAVEHKEIQRLIKTMAPERLPMLDRIVYCQANEGGDREFIWDSYEVALVRDIFAHENRERFFNANEADRYLRHLLATTRRRVTLMLRIRFAQRAKQATLIASLGARI